MEEFLSGIMVTVIGMGVTFIALIALSYILDLFRILSEGPSKKVEEPKQNVVKVEEVSHEEVSKQEDDLELVAVITAAIAASLNTSTDALKVRSFRRINSSASAWNREGRISQIKNTI